MTIKDLTVNFAHLDSEELLADWQWLIGTDKVPVLLAACGDAFVQDLTDGSIHVLDVAAGEVKLVADSMEEFRGLLADPKFVVNHLAVEMIGDLKAHGHTLAPGQIFSFKTPPVLGGDYILENIEPTDIEVHFSVAGQLHEKLQNLPTGTVIRGVAIK